VLSDIAVAVGAFLVVVGTILTAAQLLRGVPPDRFEREVLKQVSDDSSSR
jgi:hypothetical protein